MTRNNSRNWRFNRQINLSILIQLTLMASLILVSWVNLQCQLKILQRDMTMLLQCYKKYEQRIESLSTNVITYEYRLRAIEKILPDADIANQND